jgi:hypothetical protein
MEHRHSVPPPRFVPSGVDAQTWLGFEQRIQERRYKALLDTIKASVARRDGMAARAALEEARELRPAAPELAQLSARVALLPTVMPEAASASHLWQRPLGAAAMLIVGVGLVAGLESMRSTATEAPVTTAAVRAATAAPAPPVSAAPVTVDAAALPAAPSAPAEERSRLARPGCAARRSPTSAPPTCRTVEPFARPSTLNRLFRPAGKFLTTTLPRVLGVKVVEESSKPTRRRPARRSRPT